MKDVKLVLLFIFYFVFFWFSRFSFCCVNVILGGIYMEATSLGIRAKASPSKRQGITLRPCKRNTFWPVCGISAKRASIP